MENDKSQKDKDVPSGQVVKLTELVQYREGAIVPRIIIDKPNGSCRTVALDKGQERGEHTSPAEALVYILEGEAEIKVAGQANHLQQGDLIIIPANESHGIKALEKLKVFSVMVKS